MNLRKSLCNLVIVTMQPTPRRTVETKFSRRDKIKEDTLLANKKSPEDKLKNISSITTPRNFIQQSSPADIYAKNKGPKSAKAPKKAPTQTSVRYASPMTSLLKSSPSTTTIPSFRSSISSARGPKTPRGITRKPESKILDSARSVKTKNLTNVTVNSPINKRKAELRTQTQTVPNDEQSKIDRQRTKTRTLNEDEAKILKENIVDNNAEMKNLVNKLSAKSKSFYVRFDDEKGKGDNEVKLDKQSEEEVSYEDDFESYESDFESDHTEESEKKSESHTTEDDGSDTTSHDERSNTSEAGSKTDTSSNKETRDEEKMLDSGNFDLRDPQRSAQRTQPMDNIVEDMEHEVEKRTSLTDEGFLEMSNSSATSSLKTMDILDRPLFVDFTKSKNNRRKKKHAERLQQRAKDLLSMISLHAMSYSLFELTPIPYDVYMTTFGRSNYTQAYSQTFDDGVDGEVQTETIDYENKWTQYPVEFSINDVCTTGARNIKRKKSSDFLPKFIFLHANENLEADEENTDDSYVKNPLRIYLEQKNGAGSDRMLPYDSYKRKFQENECSGESLRRFIKKTGRRVINILSNNQKNSTKLGIKSSKYPFSAGYSLISTEAIDNSELQFVKFSKITNAIFSDTKSNLVLTVHKKFTSGVLLEKSLICLWDMNMALKEPLKILVAVNDVTVGKFRGGSDGILVAALEDGSIHLWDLSEAATWYPMEEDVEDQSTQLQEVQDHEHMTQAEIDREWNLKNSNVGVKGLTIHRALQSCAFTSSARNMLEDDQGHPVVGMEFLDDAKLNIGGGKKIIGQICSLQEHGVLTIWSIIHEKSKCKSTDIGKAYWSKLSLQKSTDMYLSEYVDSLIFGSEINTIFNLNAAKRRISKRKLEKNVRKARPNSNTNFDSGDFDNSRPASVASKRSRHSAKITNDWNNCLICNDLKVVTLDNVVNFLIAKNCGEVLRCTRGLTHFKVERLNVTNDTSSIIYLEISPHGLPYFLAATDTGTINLCSLVESRVLLILDCRNGPPVPEVERYQTDPKGRFMGTLNPKKSSSIPDRQALIKSVHWLRSNPCSIAVISQDGAISEWQLERSDICPSYRKQYHVVACRQANDYLSLVMADGNVEVHNLSHKQNLASTMHLFQKYVTLL